MLVTDTLMVVCLTWLSLMTLVFMLGILWIHHIEIKNSKSHLNLKMALHYHHMFHRTKIIFDKYNVFKTYRLETCKELVKMVQDHGTTIEEAHVALSQELSKNCVNNEYLFISQGQLRTSILDKTKALVHQYQNWSLQVLAIKNDVTILEEATCLKTWNTLSLQYQVMVDLLVDIHGLLVNEAYIDVVQRP